MKKLILSTTLLLAFARVLSAAEPVTLYFEKVEPKALTTLSLHIEDGKVYGNQHWIPKDMDGAHGTVEGTIKDDTIRAIYSYTIEGSEQSEEQIYKLQGNKLLVGEGEMKEDPKNETRTLFRKVSDVTFTKSMKKLNVLEPKPGDPVRKAIMDALRGPVSKHIGKPVQFTGNVRVYGDWARFGGGAETLDGKPPANDDAAGELELDLTAFLHKDENGVWKPVHWGFAGDISVIEDAREKCADAHWVMFD